MLVESPKGQTQRDLGNLLQVITEWTYYQIKDTSAGLSPHVAVHKHAHATHIRRCVSTAERRRIRY